MTEPDSTIQWQFAIEMLKQGHSMQEIQKAVSELRQNISGRAFYGSLEEDTPPSLPTPTNMVEEIESYKAENSKLQVRLVQLESQMKDEQQIQKNMVESFDQVKKAGLEAVKKLMEWSNSLPKGGRDSGYTQRDEIAGVAGKLQKAIDNAY